MLDVMINCGPYTPYVTLALWFLGAFNVWTILTDISPQAREEMRKFFQRSLVPIDDMERLLDIVQTVSVLIIVVFWPFWTVVVFWRQLRGKRERK